MKDVNERVASLEVQHNNHHEWLGAMARDMREMNVRVGKILETIANNKGFFNGIIFTLAALGGIIGFLCAKAWDYIVNGGHHL